MKPVTVRVAVPNRREQVYRQLDVLANHEAFTDHMLVDWRCSGPRSGVGARARMRLKKPGRADWMDLEVIAAEPPRTTVEETVGAGGRRRTRGTYTLEETPDGGTRISFEIAWLRAPLLERLAAPLTRAVMRRGNQRSLQRLAAQLTPTTKENR
jgi:Polyketide cyclase / dehydrase and lipid transport